MSNVVLNSAPNMPVPLPPEVWFAIASLLSRDQLLALMTLNSVFFCAAMDEKYKSTAVMPRTHIFSAKMLHKLKDLPFISTRIQYLSIELDCSTRDSSPKPNFSSRLSQRWYTTTRRVLPSLSNSNTDSNLNLPLHTPGRYESEMVVSLFSTLTNLRHLYLKMDRFHCPVAPEVDPALSFLFGALKTSLGTTIETLALRGDLRQYSVFMDDVIHLPCIKTLKLDFMDARLPLSIPPLTAVPITNLIPILHGIARFINNQASHLETLSMETAAHINIDLSKLFSSIHKLPILRSLDLQVKMRSFLDTPGLNALLQPQSRTLRRLSMLYGFCSEISVYSPEHWILPCMKDDPLAFANLEEVQLRQGTPSEPVGPIFGLLRRASNTLKDVRILDQPLPERDLAVLIETLSHCRCLTRLHITVDIYAIKVKLFDRLSASLPHLRELVIHMESGQAWEGSGYFGGIDNSPLLLALKTRNYTDWHLETFTVMFDCDVLILSDAAQAIFRQCIPSLLYFPENPPLDSFNLYPTFTTVMGTPRPRRPIDYDF